MHPSLARRLCVASLALVAATCNEPAPQQESARQQESTPQQEPPKQQEPAPQEPPLERKAIPEAAFDENVVVLEPPRASAATRQARRDQLAFETAKSPGWELHETAHYFILTPIDDPRVVAELKERCESIRAAIREDFPHPEVDPVPVATAPNVVRVCKDEHAYHQFGGPGGSRGYWSHWDGEVVIYDHRGEREADATWSTLQGMLYFEYVEEVFGDTLPPACFHIGHSEYYSGFRLVQGEYRIEAPADRAKVARACLAIDPARAGCVSLREFVRIDDVTFRRGRISGKNFSSGELAAQAWSFIWFLRQAPAKSPEWNPAWNGLLDRWWSAWLETRDVESAADRAFAGIDWAALELAWRRFIVE